MEEWKCFIIVGFIVKVFSVAFFSVLISVCCRCWCLVVVACCCRCKQSKLYVKQLPIAIWFGVWILRWRRCRRQPFSCEFSSLVPAPYQKQTPKLFTAMSWAEHSKGQYSELLFWWFYRGQCEAHAHTHTFEVDRHIVCVVRVCV